MKTMTKKLAVLGVVAVALIGCAESNEKTVMTDPATGATSGTGTMAPNTPRSSADFANKTKSAFSDPAAAAKYKSETTGSGK